MRSKILIETFTLSLIIHIEALSQSCPQSTYPHKFAPPFNSMVVFGDSFSDVGNIHIESNGTQPGIWSYDGRYSDGRVWQEYIQQFFQLPELTPSLDGGLNYAYGGATVDNSYIQSYSSYLDREVPGVSDQISQYLEDEGGIVASDRLHVLYAGYNDYWWYVYHNYTTVDGQDFNLTNVYINVANTVMEQVERLYDGGVRMFLIGNVPNMSSWAEAALQTQEVLDSYDVLWMGHNRLLQSLLSEFEQRYDATVYQFDTATAFYCLKQNREYFGVQNVNDACHPSKSENCGDIFSYTFWDYYHPTTHAHQIASMSALQSIYEKDSKKPRSKSAKNPPFKTLLRSNA